MEVNQGIAESLEVELHNGFNAKLVEVIKPAYFTRYKAVVDYIRYVLDQDPREYRWRINQENRWIS